MMILPNTTIQTSVHFTDLGVLVKVLENLPAPVLVPVILREPVQVEETLYGLWSQEVVSVCKLSPRIQTLHYLFFLTHIKVASEASINTGVKSLSRQVKVDFK